LSIRPGASFFSACIASAFACAEPSRAIAQETRQEALSGRHKAYESPQHFAFELRFSPFKPDIDSDSALQGATPYGSVFGSSPRVLVDAELDWQAARIPHLGTIGPGLAIGYTTMTDPAQFATLHNGTLTSGENTSLEILPMYAVAVLRADVLWRELHVPLVPYAKLGVGVAYWRASNTLGTSSAQGVKGEGHTFGAQLAVGIGFNLNVLDEYAARNFDDSMGVNNTYVFAEWTRSDLTGLWAQQSPLRVGGTYWTFGLAFEF
jgi:hypothetical protein